MGHEFFGEKIIFPSAPVPGINNDQSLISTAVSDGVSTNVFVKTSGGTRRQILLHVLHIIYLRFENKSEVRYKR